MYDVVQKFRIMQMGFTVFVANAPGSFVAYPFNVYMFPEAGWEEEEANIILDMDTVNFHKDHHFDFNKWFYEGLSSTGGTEDSTKLGLRKTVSDKPGIGEAGYEFMDQDTVMRTDSDSETSESCCSKENAEKLFQALVNFKVPLIGHNLMVDLMFLYDEFCGPLPDSLSEFKCKIAKIFPSYFSTVNPCLYPNK